MHLVVVARAIAIPQVAGFPSAAAVRFQNGSERTAEVK
jgi:hypothetical protein